MAPPFAFRAVFLRSPGLSPRSVGVSRSSHPGCWRAEAGRREGCPLSARAPGRDPRNPRRLGSASPGAPGPGWRTGTARARAGGSEGTSGAEHRGGPGPRPVLSPALAPEVPDRRRAGTRRDVTAARRPRERTPSRPRPHGSLSRCRRPSHGLEAPEAGGPRVRVRAGPRGGRPARGEAAGGRGSWGVLACPSGAAPPSSPRARGSRSRGHCRGARPAPGRVRS